MTQPIQEIYDTPDDGNGMELLAIVVKHNYCCDGPKFFTAPQSHLQVGCIHHRAGHVVQAHYHRERPREVFTTQEVLYVREGFVKVTLYDRKGAVVCTKHLYKGDLIMLAGGGHAVEFVQDSWLYEVKMGPYDPEEKVRI